MSLVVRKKTAEITGGGVRSFKWNQKECQKEHVPLSTPSTVNAGKRHIQDQKTSD